MVKGFFKVNRIERILFIQACFLNVIYSLYIALIPNRIVFKRLGNRGVESSFELNSERLEEVLQVEKATRRAVRFLPWKTKCFARAIAAKRLLQHKKITSTIYLGVAKKDNNRMIAHAWLRCGNKIITGKEEMHRFTPIVFYT